MSFEVGGGLDKLEMYIVSAKEGLERLKKSIFKMLTEELKWRVLGI